MAEGGFTELSYKKQTGINVPATGQYTKINHKEVTFKLDKGKEVAKDITGTREYSRVKKKSKSTDGGFVSCLEFDNFDEILEGALGGSWSDVAGGTGGGVITAGAAASNLEITFTEEAQAGDGGVISLGTGITFDILKDQVIFIKNAPDESNNGAFIVKSVSNRDITVNSPLTTATYEATTVIAGDRLRNANVQSFYSFEIAHLDIAKSFQLTDQIVANTEFKFVSEEEIDFNFSFIGRDKIPSNIRISDPIPATKTKMPDFIVGDNVDGVFFDYETIETCKLEEFSLKIDNQTEAKKGVAIMGMCRARMKPILASGDMTLTLSDLTEFNKFYNDTPFNFTIIQADSLGNKYALTMPDVEYTTESTDMTDLEEEVPEEHEFIATTNGVFTIQICKCAA